jgi:hypothetical protein
MTGECGRASIVKPLDIRTEDKDLPCSQ